MQQGLGLKVWSRSESEFEKGVKLHIMGPKPGDLPMVRLKWKLNSMEDRPDLR